MLNSKYLWSATSGQKLSKGIFAPCRVIGELLDCSEITKARYSWLFCSISFRLSSLCFLWQELRESLEAAATLLSSNLDAALASLEKSGSATAAAEREQLRIEAASVAASSEAAVCQEVSVQPFILIRSTTNLNMFSLEFTDCIKMVKIWS